MFNIFALIALLCMILALKWDEIKLLLPKKKAKKPYTATCHICGNVRLTSEMIATHYADSIEIKYDCGLCTKPDMDDMRESKMKFHPDTFSTVYSPDIYSTSSPIYPISSHTIKPTGIINSD